MSLPNTFAQIVVDGIPGILAHQQPDGSIIYAPSAPMVYPQQAIYPLAFVYAGLDPQKRYRGSDQILTAIRRLGDFLMQRTDERGEIHYDSNGYDVKVVDQRLWAAWLEGMNILREAGADLPFDTWGQRLAAGCQTLIDHRMRSLAGVRRFIGRVMGTSTNHVCLYISTIYRGGQVLSRPDFIDFVLPIGRAMAADVNPDGYWDEHSLLERIAGPTPSYNYLTHCGMALMAEWTGEDVFRQAVDRSTRFHATFCYPDATFLDILDERVRYGHDPAPRVWGLFGFSHSPEGRGSALRHIEGWLRSTKDPANVAPETLARMCENFQYWHEGPVAPAPFEQANHQARLDLPGGIFRRGAWAVGLSAMPATNPEDPAYRDNPFALDRQKLFSVWHEKIGLIIDGSNSKKQPENSTFSAPNKEVVDYYPVGGAISAEAGELLVRATYKSFEGRVRLRPVSDKSLQITFEIDPAACLGPFTASFTLRGGAASVGNAKGQSTPLDAETFTLTGERFSVGSLTVQGPPEMRFHWPLAPFNSYAANSQSSRHAWLPRIALELTPQRPSATVTIVVGD